ncbi:MAG: hypothetical protein GX765_05630 [Candidatus Moranbacteria bacterium]|nr:hypothetical protein [Candidatus Moranbacteria bacterium]
MDENLLNLLDTVVKCNPQANRNEMLKYLIVSEARRLSEFDDDAKKALELWRAKNNEKSR